MSEGVHRLKQEAKRAGVASEIQHAIERVFREESGKVLAGLIRVVRDFDLAEDALQDAIAIALDRWPVDGVPRNPAAWLATAARRKAIDRLRHLGMRHDKHAILAQLAALQNENGAEMESDIGDERLRLIFTCCHPSLAVDAQVALTLRTLGGLTTVDIARAFLLPEPTLARRLSRAKKKIREARVPYRVPERDQLPERLDAVLATIYLIFNEGYGSAPGESPTRDELCVEAIRLGRMLVGLMPSAAEALGLMALMLLHHSRRDARLDASGAFVPLDRQDRGRWDGRCAAEGIHFLRRATELRQPGPYQTQAAISAAHAESPSAAATDWQSIAALYEALERMRPSAVVRLNRAIAVSRACSPRAGLDLLEGSDLARALADYQPYHAARADLLRRAGATGEAVLAFERAIELTSNAADRAYLERQLAGLVGVSG